MGNAKSNIKIQNCNLLWQNTVSIILQLVFKSSIFSWKSVTVLWLCSPFKATPSVKHVNITYKFNLSGSGQVAGSKTHLRNSLLQKSSFLNLTPIQPTGQCKKCRFKKLRFYSTRMFFKLKIIPVKCLSLYLIVFNIVVKSQGQISKFFIDSWSSIIYSTNPWIPFQEPPLTEMIFFCHL